MSGILSCGIMLFMLITGLFTLSNCGEGNYKCHDNYVALVVYVYVCVLILTYFVKLRRVNKVLLILFPVSILLPSTMVLIEDNNILRDAIPYITCCFATYGAISMISDKWKE